MTLFGNMMYKGGGGAGDTVTGHRAKAAAAIAAFRAKHPYYSIYDEAVHLQYHDLTRLLWDTKILISPWGWGEYSL